MNSSSKSSYRRCRPLLGTFVEITAEGEEQAKLVRAVNAAFEAIERVQRRMSAHDEASELSRMNAAAFNRPVKLSAEMFTVIRRGLELAEASSGAFDFTVAPVLARWGFLPGSLRRRTSGDWRHVRLLSGNRVRFERPLAIDLGGIAKGFAVDAAIAALRRNGVTRAIVNAGGDLRCIGAEESLVHLRHPGSAQPIANPIRLCEAALATSSPCFSRRRWRGTTISHLVDPIQGRAVTRPISVSVRAAECWLADALTKVVLNSPTNAEEILHRHGAEAFVVIV